MSIVERTVVVPKQNEVVEITLRMTQTQANKVRALLGYAWGCDKDTWQMYNALVPVTDKIPLTYMGGGFKFEKEPT